MRSRSLRRRWVPGPPGWQRSSLRWYRLGVATQLHGKTPVRPTGKLAEMAAELPGKPPIGCCWNSLGGECHRVSQELELLSRTSKGGHSGTWRRMLLPLLKSLRCCLLTTLNILPAGKRERFIGSSSASHKEQRRVDLELRRIKLMSGTNTDVFIDEMRGCL